MYNALEGAFAQKGFLVKLTYAQEVFIVAVSTDDALTKKDAAKFAARQAREAQKYDKSLRYGNLIHAEVKRDTPGQRSSWGVDGASFADEEVVLFKESELRDEPEAALPVAA